MEFFQIVGIWEVNQERLNNFVRADIAWGPRCFRWRLEILSGPRALDEDKDLIISWVCSGLNGGSRVGSSLNWDFRVRITFLFVLSLGIREIEA